MPSSTDLRRQAARCLRAAAALDDRETAAALVALADNFSTRADEIDPSLKLTGRKPNRNVAVDGGKADSASR
jgi:hypothetical protein